METKKSLSYLRAKRKVETLKGFYGHLVVFILINSAIILVSANVFNKREIDLADWSNYVTLFFWGFGMLSHAVYVFFIMNVEINFLKRWEEKKMNQFLNEDKI